MSEQIWMDAEGNSLRTIRLFRPRVLSSGEGLGQALVPVGPVWMPKRRLDERRAARVQVGLDESGSRTSIPSWVDASLRTQDRDKVAEIWTRVQDPRWHRTRSEIWVRVWKMSPKRGQRMQKPSPGRVLGRPRDGHGRTGAGQAFTAFVSSLPIFQPQTTGALLPENAISQSVAESLVFSPFLVFPQR